jgi:Icc-related predicted phosphoesterase
LIKVFKPRLHLHGHIHLYSQDSPRETKANKTRVINVYSYRVIDLIDSPRPSNKTD